MDKPLFFMIFGILAILYGSIGYAISRKIKSVEDYFLAGRKLTVFQLAISLIATQLGAGFILGTSHEAYSLGFYGLLYVLGTCAGFILLACGVAGRLRALQVETTAQIFETHYNSIFLKKIASLCSIISLIGIFAAQVVGLRALFVSLGVYNPLFFLVLWLAIISYATIGGLQAIVKNDIFQLSIIILVFYGLFFYDSFLQLPGLAAVFTNYRELFIPEVKLLSWSNIIIIPLMPALYSLIEQDLAQVFFAAQNARKAIVAAWYAGLFLLCFALVPVYFGMKTRILGIPLELHANPLLVFFDRMYSSFIVTLVAYGVVAAIISSANGILCAISSNIVQDFGFDRIFSRSRLGISKLVMFCVGLFGVALASYCDNVIRVLVQSYAVPVTALLVSLMVAYYAPKENTRNNTLAAYVSVFSGLGVFILLTVLQKALLSPELDALIISAISYGLVLFSHNFKIINKK